MCPPWTQVVQLLSHVQPFASPWTVAHQASQSFTVSRVCSNSCTLSQWCHPIISSVIPFSSCPQSFLASGSFPVNWLFASDGQTIGASASASVLPVNIQGSFPLGLSGWFPLLTKGLSRVFSRTTIQKHQLFGTQPSLWSQLSHPYMITGKTKALTIQKFVSKVISLFLNMLSRFVIAFLPKSKHLLILWLQSPSAVILESKKIKSVTVSTFSPLPWSDGTECHDLTTDPGSSEDTKLDKYQRNYT